MRTSTNTFAQRSIRAAVLVGLLGCGLAGAQEYPPDLKAALIASPESAKTIELKDARVLTYRELVELPESERLELLKLSKERMPRFRFLRWEVDTAEALADEAKKLRDVALVREADAQKRLDIALAGEADAQKGLDTAVAKLAGNIEDLANTIHQAIVLKIQLDRSYRTTLENAFNIKGVADRLKPETLSFLKSVLARPELFRDK